MKRLLLAVTALLCLTFAALAADVSGKWTAEVPGRDGNTMTMTMDLKADGDKLTGTISGPRGEAPIENGKISGDEISFSQTFEFNGNSRKIDYHGKVKGDTIDFTRGMGERQAKFTAKR